MSESLFSLFEYKSDSLVMKEQFTLLKSGKTAWTLDLKIYIRLFGFVFIKTKERIPNPEIVEQDVLV